MWHSKWRRPTAFLEGIGGSNSFPRNRLGYFLIKYLILLRPISLPLRPLNLGAIDGSSSGGFPGPTDISQPTLPIAFLGALGNKLIVAPTKRLWGPSQLLPQNSGGFLQWSLGSEFGGGTQTGRLF